MKDFLTLTKPRITLMAVLMAMGGLFLSKQPLDSTLIFFALLGTALAVASANVLNMVLEKEVDKKMERTRQRPLPDERMTASTALIFGITLGTLSIFLLWIHVNPLTCVLASFALITYVGIYTPLKLKSPWALVVGAIPGAMPPLMGWTAATNSIQLAGLILFAILLLWQIPHFIAISMYRKQEYAAAGIRTITQVYGERMAKLQASIYAAALIPVSLGLVISGQVHWLYVTCAVGAGTLYLATCLQGWVGQDQINRAWSRKLFFVSLMYLPLVSIGLILDVILL